MWLARNNARDDKEIEEPRSIMERVLGLIKEWESNNERPTAMLPSSSTQCWERLDYGWVKANCDGPMSKASDFGGGGTVLRDPMGSI